MNNSHTYRYFGLNLLGFGATLMVVFGHLMLFRSSGSVISSQVAPLFGFLGIEVLIVLSGFVIGQYCIALLLANDSFSTARLWDYLKRIAWWVLPCYYLVLVVNIIVSFILGYSDLISWKYFFFLQNFVGSLSSFFPESWSIALVFWGCVFLFVIFIFLFKNQKAIDRSNIMFWVTICLILISIGCKCIYYFLHRNTTLLEWDQNLKSVVIFRLDSFYIGVLSSWVHFNFLSFCKKYSKVLFLGSAILMLFLFVGIGYFRLLIDTQPFFWDVMYLPLTSFTITLTLPFVFQLSCKSHFTAVFFSFGASISYGMFLIHYSILLQIANHYFVLSDASLIKFILFSILYLLIAIVISFVLSRFIEKILLSIGVKN